MPFINRNILFATLKDIAFAFFPTRVQKVECFFRLKFSETNFFRSLGVYLRKIGCEGVTNFPNGIDISDHGDILVGDSHGNRFHVAVFKKQGELVSEFECPQVKVSFNFLFVPRVFGSIF